MARSAGVWRWIGDSPVDDFLDRIVTSRQSPGGSGTAGNRGAAPGLVAIGIFVTGRRIESPKFGSRFRIVSGNVTTLPAEECRQVRPEIILSPAIIKPELRRPPLLTAWFPSEPASAHIQRNNRIARWIKDQVQIHREGLRIRSAAVLAACIPR